MENIRILAINPGSTSTKIAVYNNTKSAFLKNIKHSASDLGSFRNIASQFEFRKKHILDELDDAGIEIESLNAVIGRGGLIKPIPSGVYEVNKAMIRDLKKGIQGEHASNLGGLIANDIAMTIPAARSFIADPVVVDEMQDVARITGHPLFERRSIFHALNHKAIGRIHAESIDSEYDKLNLIIAHLGGGISVGAHKQGRVIDVNNALDGEGPFSPERTGTLPAGCLARTCFDDNYTHDDVKKMITGHGGLMAYFNTNDAYEIEIRAGDGDPKAVLIQNAMAYQTGKEIGAMSAVLKGRVHAIILTGGMAHNPTLVSYIKDMVSYIAPVIIYPGEDEMKALAMNALMVMTGKIKPKVYS
ncbi:MAG: butyrate kinase [Marinilabiliales bacterium]|nr:MAG: butyrate kinase [Marinilabiliales bacterium]